MLKLLLIATLLTSLVYFWEVWLVLTAWLLAFTV